MAKPFLASHLFRPDHFGGANNGGAKWPSHFISPDHFGGAYPDDDTLAYTILATFRRAISSNDSAAPFDPSGQPGLTISSPTVSASMPLATFSFSLIISSFSTDRLPWPTVLGPTNPAAPTSALGKPFLGQPVWLCPPRRSRASWARPLWRSPTSACPIQNAQATWARPLRRRQSHLAQPFGPDHFGDAHGGEATLFGPSHRTLRRSPFRPDQLGQPTWSQPS